MIPAAEQVLFQLLRVVILPVADDPELPSPLTAHHGLDAAGLIPDGKPGVGEPNIVPQIFPGLIVPPVCDDGSHACGNLCPRFRTFQKIHVEFTKSGNSSHKYTPQQKTQGALRCGEHPCFSLPIYSPAAGLILRLCRPDACGAALEQSTDETAPPQAGTRGAVRLREHLRSGLFV